MDLPLFRVHRVRGDVLHPFEFFAAREDFIALVERASKPATPTFLSALRAAHPFWLRLRCSVLSPFEFFAARDDSAVTLAPEGRQIVAQCVSTGNGVKDRRAPERGGRTGDECFFRPVPGLANLLYGPRARALGYSLSPSGLREHFLVAACRSAGQPILAAAGFQPAFTGAATCASARKSRPKGGCGQDCLMPHSFPDTGNAAEFVGQTPLVCAGRPRPAAGATISAPCKARAGRRGRRPQSRGTAPRPVTRSVTRPRQVERPPLNAARPRRVVLHVSAQIRRAAECQIAPSGRWIPSTITVLKYKQLLFCSLTTACCTCTLLRSSASHTLKYWSLRLGGYDLEKTFRLPVDALRATHPSRFRRCPVYQRPA